MMNDASPLRFASESAFDAHCAHIEAATRVMEHGNFELALAELDKALTFGESPHARWNRGQTLLALGRYDEAWSDYASRWWLFQEVLMTPRGARLRNVLPVWEGEPLNDRRLVVVHEAGFGDTIMLLRYIPILLEAGFDVVLEMPNELKTLAAQLAPLLDQEGERDVHCTTFDLPRLLGPVIPSAPYLVADTDHKREWQRRIGDTRRRKIGVAWSTIRGHADKRKIDLDFLCTFITVRRPDWLLYSIQGHDLEAAADRMMAFEFVDFADLAAFVANMDAIISIDTAALHIAGAIDHPDISALLPSVSCWRWRNGSPWYPNVKLCTQAAPGDWASALAKAIA